MLQQGLLCTVYGSSLGHGEETDSVWSSRLKTTTTWGPRPLRTFWVLLSPAAPEATDLPPQPSSRGRVWICRPPAGCLFSNLIPLILRATQVSPAYKQKWQACPKLANCECPSETNPAQSGATVASRSGRDSCICDRYTPSTTSEGCTETLDS